MKDKKSKVVAPGQQHLKKTVLALAATLLFGLIYYYFTLPALNLQNRTFYSFFLLLVVVYCAVYLAISGALTPSVIANPRELWMLIRRTCFVPLILSAVLGVVFVIGILLSSTFLRASSYRDMLVPEQGVFQDEVEPASYDRIPMLDKASAQRLGDRKLGELADMVSQFEVASDYTQINFNGRPVRVASLLYGDFFKWLNNARSGLPGYILTDMVNQSVEVVRLDQGIRYSQADLFFRNIDRYIRFLYPTYMFETPHMEIDDEGVPYWICPRMIKTIGLFGGTDIGGAVLVNAVTGETAYYPVAEIPVWVDIVFSARLIIEQYDFHGAYINGFLNSLFGQTGVTKTTEGYNYMAQNDDVYMYTGITSVGGDESNIGFILSNQRTKETRYYPCAGAEEFSAMSSAEGIVQHLNYRATFPLLLNLAGHPTYFMSLKDNAGLVKMYAMVNVQQYNIVAYGTTVAECEREYMKLLIREGITDGIIRETETASGRIADIRSAVIDGNSYYYLRLEGDPQYYVLSASDDESVVVMNVGDRIKIEYQLEAKKDNLYTAKRVD